MPAAPIKIARETLIPVVDRALGQPVDDVGPWTVEPIGYAALNPLSQGLYRIAGSARRGASTVPWSFVLKVLRAPGDADFAQVAPEERETLLEALRWDREVDAYDSGLLTTLPAGLAAPRCFATERADGGARIWLESIIEDSAVWDVPRYALAARHLGRFNGEYIAGRPIPEYPWLSRHWLRDWVKHFTRTSAGPLADDRVWAQPLTRELFPGDVRKDLRRLLAEYELWWRAVEELPATLSHLDAFRANLLSRRQPDGVETVAVDWSFMGVAPLGAEVSHLVIGSVFHHGDPVDPAALADECLSGYAEGLGDSGRRLPIAELRRAYVINAVVRWAFILGPLGAVGDAAREEAIAEQRGMPFRDILAPFAAKTTYLCALSREVVLD